MKQLFLSLSVLLTARAAVAIPPPDCDGICSDAQKWNLCVASYTGPTDGLTADEFCRSNGLTNTNKDCKLCPNNGYGGGPNHRPGGVPRLARRIDDSSRAARSAIPPPIPDPCAMFCTYRTPEEYKANNCDQLCKPRGGGPNKPGRSVRRSVPAGGAPPPLLASERLSLAEFQAQCARLTCRADAKEPGSPRALPPGKNVSFDMRLES
jgi:hypothetical protein